MLGSHNVFAERLLRWYDAHRRDLPWRIPAGPHGRPDPYHVLVSELMLQQTQVAPVVPYFHRFLARFPTLADLAAAPEQDVLRLWQGLGYYSRARNLQRAAQRAVADHGGTVPGDVTSLLALPGVGRYTAGAVASIAFGVRAPIVDGNVIRVLCRLDKVETDPRTDRATQDLLWRRAEEVLPAGRVGDFNSALMELGATVCTPRNPQCLICPVREHCAAQAAGVQETIPPPKKAKPTPTEKRVVVCVRRAGRWLIEQRPATGRWAGMWQFFAREAGPRGALAPPVPASRPKRIGKVEHQLTHRRYEFDVKWCEATGDEPADLDRPHAWEPLDGLAAYPMSKPHLTIAGMLRDL
ncbi:MAG TPA: A/G-specific adenine glycosylase [Humisphaera sp.]